MTPRSACPWDACRCWFIQDSTLFPTLTNSRVQVVLHQMKSQSDFYELLKDEWISLSDRDGQWIFPSWVCIKIRYKLLEKMRQLKIELPKNNLFSSYKLLPATWPDDESEPSTGSGGMSLVWDDDWWAPIVPSRAWNQNPEQLRLDE
jgi:hypothetical protein